MKTLLTGASGFLGSYLSKLVKADTRRYQLLAYGDIKYACKDVERIYHLAAETGGIEYLERNAVVVAHNNAVMGLNVLEAALQRGVKEFYNIASVCMYPDVMLKEGNVNFGLPVAETRGYGLAKRFVMNMANMYASDSLKVVNLVLTNLYGAGDRSSNVVSELVSKICNAEINGLKSVNVLGEKDTTRDLLYVEDCANIIAEMPSDAGTVNVATGVEVSIGTLISVICDTVGYKGRIVYTGEWVGQKRRKIDIRKLRSLGFEPQTSLEEGIFKTVGWYMGKQENLDEKFREFWPEDRLEAMIKPATPLLDQIGKSDK